MLRPWFFFLFFVQSRNLQFINNMEASTGNLLRRSGRQSIHHFAIMETLDQVVKLLDANIVLLDHIRPSFLPPRSKAATPGGFSHGFITQASSSSNPITATAIGPRREYAGKILRSLDSLGTDKYYNNHFSKERSLSQLQLPY